jgi:hypothetical protein
MHFLLRSSLIVGCSLLLASSAHAWHHHVYYPSHHAMPAYGVHSYAVSPYAVHSYAVAPYAVTPSYVHSYGVSTYGVTPYYAPSYGVSSYGLIDSQLLLGLLRFFLTSGGLPAPGGSSDVAQKLSDIQQRLKTIESKIDALKPASNTGSSGSVIEAPFGLRGTPRGTDSASTETLSQAVDRHLQNIHATINRADTAKSNALRDLDDALKKLTEARAKYPK